MLMKFPDVQVVGTAQNGREAIEQVKRSQPDVMTLDVDMPGMNGLEVLDYIMAHHPLPVIMISALTCEGARVTLEALEHGAVDFIPKDGRNDYIDMASVEGQLHDKVQEAYKARIGTHQAKFRGREPILSVPDFHHQDRERVKPSVWCTGVSRRKGSHIYSKPARHLFPLVVIGSSTGGPNLLNRLVRDLPDPFPASLVIVQHMPKFFTKVFSEYLNAICPFPIREACNGDWLEPGIGFVAPGDQHLSIDRQADGRAVISITNESEALPYRPSVDCAMVSAAQHFGSFVIGVVVSGMGNDGLVGCQKIKEYGGIVLVQDEATALMYGMPRAVLEAGCADAEVSDVQLALCLLRSVDAILEEGTLLIAERLPSTKGVKSSG